jgi:hypothetical protein
MTPAELSRVLQAVHDTSVSREAVEFEWPECHKPRCQGSHGSPDRAMGIVLHKVSENITNEMLYRLTTRADVAEADADPDEQAAQNFAVLLTRYTPEKHNTYIQAARALMEAYPALVDVFAPATV